MRPLFACWHRVSDVGMRSSEPGKCSLLSRKSRIRQRDLETELARCSTTSHIPPSSARRSKHVTLSDTTSRQRQRPPRVSRSPRPPSPAASALKMETPTRPTSHPRLKISTHLPSRSQRAGCEGLKWQFLRTLCPERDDVSVVAFPIAQPDPHHPFS